MNTRAFVLALTCVAAALSCGSATARNDQIRLKISDAMAQPDAVAQLGKGVRFFFGDSAHPPVERSAGIFKSNQKANGFDHSDASACYRAFLSAMLSLQARAIKEGGDAVINITSLYKSDELSSATEFQCGAGAIVVGVALRGDVVKLKN
jgi:hypothetical protein